MNSYEQLASLLEQSQNTVFFGGAGVSTESGIPDFRGEGGLYTVENSPEEMLHTRFFSRHPEEFWAFYRSSMVYPDARPNAAHRILAKWEQEGKLQAVITQNIDGLHQKAGSKQVLELHGSGVDYDCTRCRRSYGEQVLLTEGVPRCEACGGVIRPRVVFYGEGLDGWVWRLAEQAVEEAELLIVGGSSLTVYPAAGLVAGFSGEHLVIVNRDPTPLDGLAKLVIRESLGEVLTAVEELR